MAITVEFKEAIQVGNVMRVRIMLKNSLLVDPTVKQYDEMEKYACAKMENIYVEHNGEHLDFEISSWSKNYLNQQMAVVVDNFSKERIGLLKAMVRYLYKDRINKNHYEKNKTYNNTVTHKQVNIGITVIGIGLTATGICSSKILLTIGGAVVTVIGAVFIFKDRR